MNSYLSTYGEFSYEKWELGSNLAKWTFATDSNGQEYFIKVLSSPIKPDPNSGHSENFMRDKMSECEAFANYKEEVFGRLKSISDGIGNLITPIHYGWSTDGHYEIISHKGENKQLRYDELSQLDDLTFLRAVRVLCYNINRVHEVGIVHGDLKPLMLDENGGELDPGNIMFSINEKGFPVFQIIDFDDSYISCDALPPEDIGGMPEYYSPELFGYKKGLYDLTAEDMTTKSDIFTMGLIIHQYANNGEFPPHGDYANCIAYLFEGNTIEVNCATRPYMNDILNRMLSLDPESRPDLSSVISDIDNIIADVTEGTKTPESGSEESQDLKTDTVEDKEESITPDDDAGPYAEIEKSFLKNDPNIISAKVMPERPSLIRLTYSNGSQVVKRIGT